MPRLLALLLLSALASVAAAQGTEGPRGFVVNEIMYDPPTGSAGEYVEVLNASTAPLALDGLALADAADTTRIETDAPALVDAGGFVVLVRDGAAFAAAFPGVPFVEVRPWPALNNDGDTVRLLREDGGAFTQIDAVPYRPSWGGADASLERVDPAGPSASASNFATSTDPRGGTPGAPNSVFAPDETPPALVAAEALSATEVVVRFDEPLDEASASAPSAYSISDGVGAPASVAVAPDGDAAAVRLTLAASLPGPRTFLLVVRGVADRRGNVLDEASVAFFFGEGDAPAPGDLVVNEFLYDPPTGGAGEYVELLNRTPDKTFDLRALTLDDASVRPTPITDAPVFVEPGGYAVVVADGAAFAAAFPDVPFVEQPGFAALNNGGDSVVLGYLAPDAFAVLDSVAYAADWGGDGVALERKDPAGPSSSRANFAPSIAPAGGTPGAPNSVFERDTFGPQPIAGAVTADERGLAVTFDEPLDAASATASAFTLSAPGASVPAIAGVAYTPGAAPTVTLAFADRLPAGPLTLSVDGVRDLLGNVTAGATLAVEFAPDRTPPSVASAEATSATTVEVAFSEVVPAATALDAASYRVSDGVGAPEAVAYAPGRIGTAVRLTLAAPLEPRRLYTLTVAGLADRSGNVSAPEEVLLLLGEADAPVAGDLVVNEILFAPATGSAGEYVELLNRSEKVFDLRDFLLTDDGATDGATDGAPVSQAPRLVAPGAIVVLARAPDSVRAAFPEASGLLETRALPSLNNDGDAVVLTYVGGAPATVDSVRYADAWHRPELRETDGVALERIAPDGPSSAASNWSSSLAPRGGTPGGANSVFVDPAAPPPGDAGLAIDSPFAPDEGQSARIQYTLSTDAALVRVRVFDGAGRPVRTLEAGDLVGRTGFLDWDGRDDAGRRLRVGIYVVLLEAIDARGGTTEAFKDVAVLARRF